MMRIAVRWIIIVMIVWAFPRFATAAEMRQDGVLVTVSAGRAPSFISRNSGAYTVTSVLSDSTRSVFLIRTRSGNSITASAGIHNDPAVLRVQPNYMYRALYVPDDPSFSNQWHLAATNVESAWDFDSTAPLYGGDPSIIVAVLDTGVSYENYQSFVQAPDFSATQFASGYDFVNNDEHPNDDNGHGTHVTMTVAESTGNGVSAAGIAFASTVMPIKVLDALGSGSTATIAAGVEYARTHGARVINLSLGGTDDDPILHSAIQASVSDGIVVVAAAGNDGVESIYYPAKYSETISVGSTRFDNALSRYSNYGAGITLVAPGGQIFVDEHYSGNPSNMSILDQNSDGQADGVLQQTCVSGACSSYGDYFYEGTSQAAPQVSAAAALLLAAGVPSANIAGLLQESAKDLGTAGYDSTFGWGLLDTGRALTIGINDQTPPTGSIVANNGATYTTSKTVNLVVSAEDAVTSVSSMRFSNDGVTFSSWEPYATTKTWDLTSLSASSSDGSKTIYARFRDPAGNVSLVYSTVIVLDTAQPTLPIVSAHAPNPYISVKIIDGSATPIPQAVVSWDASSDATSGIAGYIVETSSKNKSNCSVSTVTQDLSVTVPTTSSVQTIYVTVCSVDGAGNVSDPTTFTYTHAPMTVVTADRIGRSVTITTKKGKKESSFSLFGKNVVAGLNVVRVTYKKGSKDHIAVAQLSGSNKVTIVTSTGKVVATLTPYGKKKTNGFGIDAGDVNHDGVDELIVTPLSGALPLVISTLDGKIIRSFYPFGKSFTNGFTARLARENDDVKLVVAQWSKGTTIRIFTTDGKRVRSWNAFGTATTFGASITAGDFDGNGIDEVAAAPNNGAPQVRLFRLTGKSYSQFFALQKKFNGGLTLASGPYFEDGRDALFTVPLRGPSQVQVFTDRGKVLSRFFTRSKSYRDGVTMTILR